MTKRANVQLRVEKSRTRVDWTQLETPLGTYSAPAAR